MAAAHGIKDDEGTEANDDKMEKPQRPASVQDFTVEAQKEGGAVEMQSDISGISQVPLR